MKLDFRRTNTPALRHQCLTRLLTHINIFTIYGVNTFLSIHKDMEIKYIEEVIDLFAEKNCLNIGC